MTQFSDPSSVSNYAERTARIVPGLRDLHRMAGVLLAERACRDSRVLVLGAGGGLELKAFAEMQPGWSFDGVDPSAEMLELAKTMLGPLADRVCFHNGYLDSAPAGPFDGAACLLTLHFLPREERRETLEGIFWRLKSGSALVVAHHSFRTDGAEIDKWLLRNAAYAVASGAPARQAESSISAFKERLPILSPEEDTALLVEAGFVDVELFYCGLTIKGWVAHKP